MKSSDIARDLNSMLPRSLLRLVVQVSPEDAAEVAVMMRIGMDLVARRDNYSCRDATHDVLAGLLAAARSMPDAMPDASADQNVRSDTVGCMEEVTVAEAAEILGIKRQSVHGRIKSNRLPARKGRNGHYLIARSELEAS